MQKNAAILTTICMLLCFALNYTFPLHRDSLKSGPGYANSKKQPILIPSFPLPISLGLAHFAYVFVRVLIVRIKICEILHAATSARSHKLEDPKHIQSALGLSCTVSSFHCSNTATYHAIGT